MGAVLAFPESALVADAADEERQFVLALTTARCLFVVDSGAPLRDAIGPLSDVVELARDPRSSIRFRAEAVATAIRLVDTVIGSLTAHAGG